MMVVTLPYNCYSHSQQHCYAQWCATTKVTFELTLQIHEYWRLGHTNAQPHEFAGIPHISVYQSLQVSSLFMTLMETTDSS
jgi:hypothetical protein